MSDRQDFGTFELGGSRTFTFVFQQNGVNTTPAVAPVLNISINGVRQTSPTLALSSAGTYTWTPSLTTIGQYTGTIYAPPGLGEAAQPFSFSVQIDANYP